MQEPCAFKTQGPLPVTEHTMMDKGKIQPISNDNMTQMWAKANLICYLKKKKDQLDNAALRMRFVT